MMTDVQGRIAGLMAGSGLEFGVAAIHVQSGAHVAINGDALFPTASTFKVPVMVELYAQARAGKFKITDRIEFQEKHRIIGSGVIQTLGVGLNPRIRDLCMLMQIVSDNTATDILCDLVGFANIEAKMRALGLADIHTPTDCRGLFRRAWGLSMTDELTYADFKAASRAAPMAFSSAAYARDGSNNTCSANAMAKLMALIHTNQAGTAEDCADMIAILENQHYQNRVPRFLPLGAAANKTGSLRGLRNDVGLIRRGKDDTIAYGMFTMDTTELPHGNSRELVEANVRIEGLMGETGQILWDHFGK